MHDIDRTQLEFGYDTEFDTETDGFGEIFGETTGYYGEAESPIDEVEEMEMAAELLEVSSEEELDQFLGGLIKSAGKFLKSGTGKALGGILKNVAKKALPVVGGLAGTALGSVVPGLGNIIGGAAGTAAGNIASNLAGSLFGLELEGMTAEDQEFEVARRYVRFATEAAQQAAKMPPQTPPAQAAKVAVVEAAKKHAPGLLSGGAPGTASVNGGKARGSLRFLGTLFIDHNGRLILKRR